MKLSEVGEERLVNWITSLIKHNDNTLVGLGDDCAIIDFLGNPLVLTSDMIQEGSHIYKGMTNFQAGRKLAISNFSDLASMGAKPIGFLFSLGIDQKEEFDEFKEFFHGINSFCLDYEAQLLGGDLNKSKKLILSGFAFGSVTKGELMTRKGANPGDIVAVTGPIGGAACGWQILEKELDINSFDKDIKAGIEQNVLKRCLEPTAKVKEGQILAKSGHVTSCIDISDGLAISLHYLQDNCGFLIDEKKVPVPKELNPVCEKFGLDEEKMKYHVGEDFELLCTVRPDAWSSLKKQMEAKGCNLIGIGKVIKKNTIQIKRGSSLHRLAPEGYNHFSKEI